MRTVLFFCVLCLAGCGAPRPPKPQPPIPDLRKNVETLTEDQTLKEIQFATVGGCLETVDPAGVVSRNDYDLFVANVEGCRRLRTDEYKKRLRERMISLHPEWSKETKEDIREGRFATGQTPAQLKTLLGSPKSITSNSDGSELYHYPLGYVAFRKGKVASWSFNLPAK